MSMRVYGHDLGHMTGHVTLVNVDTVSMCVIQSFPAYQEFRSFDYSCSCYGRQSCYVKYNNIYTL